MCISCAMDLPLTIGSVMEDLEASYPPKCPLWKALISKDLFERQLTTTQQNTFRTHVACTALKPGEEVIECQECGLYEIVNNDPVCWWCPHCDCGMCRVGNKDVPRGANKYDIKNSPHHVCLTLRKPKILIEQETAKCAAKDASWRDAKMTCVLTWHVPNARRNGAMCEGLMWGIVIRHLREKVGV
jgi:hypothetical protein